MAIKDALLPEFDHEMATTRRLLERVPEAEFAWKPHEQVDDARPARRRTSPTSRYWCSVTLETTVFELDSLPADSQRQLAGSSRAALIEEFDAKVGAARDQLDVDHSTPSCMTPWTLKKGGQEMFTMPRISALRSFVMNHLIHHRGQLSVYLRLKDVPLPSIYGPTADEQ